MAKFSDEILNMRVMYGPPPPPGQQRAVPLSHQPLQRYGGHPYMSYRVGADPSGQWWIECACAACHDRWRKPCMQPTRTGEHLARYAVYHSHGARPVLPR